MFFQREGVKRGSKTREKLKVQRRGALVSHVIRGGPFKNRDCGGRGKNLDGGQRQPKKRVGVNQSKPQISNKCFNWGRFQKRPEIVNRGGGGLSRCCDSRSLRNTWKHRIGDLGGIHGGDGSSPGRPCPCGGGKQRFTSREKKHRQLKEKRGTNFWGYCFKDLGFQL